MKHTPIFTADGRPLQLGSRIGKGGEGEVYTVAGSAETVVKLYTVADLRSREAKIRKMIADRLANSSAMIAFPVDLVCNAQGGFAGFTMRKVSEHQALHELYSPGARKVAFPKADYRFLVRAAANIARAVAAAHNAGCVIGDINHSGILVSDKAMAALIDADSFQITEGSVRYPCKVGVPEYTPPELQGLRLDEVARTPNHDAFGLAVVIFQLLWMGRHPFSGRYASGEMPVDKAIREHRFAYSEMRNTGMKAPPAVPALKDFPRSIAAAFEMAFGPSGVTIRPTAKQWVALLGELESSLRGCAANALHHYPSEAAECPWCKMEHLQGAQMFVPPLQDLGTGFSWQVGSVSGDVSDLWRAIEAIEAPPSGAAVPPLQSLSPSHSAAATAAKESRWKNKAKGIALLIGAGVVLVVNIGLWFIWIPAGWFGINQLRTAPDDHSIFLDMARDIEERWLKALVAWQARADETDFAACKEALRTVKREAESLPEEEKRRVESYKKNRRDAQLRAHLDAYQIRRYKISGIGPAKLAALTSYGIETAADVSSSAVQNVPGFGPTNSKPLVEWRRTLEKLFVYNPNPTTADNAALTAIRSEIKRKDLELRQRLKAGPSELRKRIVAAQDRRASVDPEMQQLHQERMQAQADLTFLGLTLPPVPMPPRPTPRPAPRTASTPSTTTSPSGQSVDCPSCGSPMIPRVARRGRNRGNRFYGCSRYPACRGTRRYP